MAALRLALAQMNPLVGGFDINIKRIVEITQDAVSRGADLVAFPELALCGYPPEDLVLRPAFLDANIDALERLVG